MKNRPPVEVDQPITLDIHDLNHSGDGVGRYNGYTLFVPETIIGDTAQVRVTQVGRQFGHAVVTKILVPSQARQSPPCPVATTCGGCQLQAMRMPGQLRWKTERIQRLFDRARLTDCAPIQPILANPTEWRYRNKAVIPISQGPDGRAVAGFFSRQSHEIVPMTDCLIQPESIAKLTQIICELIDQTQASVYDERQHLGLIRGVLIRTAPHQIVVAVIVNGTHLPQTDQWTTAIRQHPNVTGIGLMINPSKTNVPVTSDTRTLWGSLDLDYAVSTLTFRAPVQNFFQVNPSQTDAMVRQVQAWIGHRPADIVYDLYCGVGTFGLAIAPQVARVYACELTPDSHRYAVYNAMQNDITNVSFETGDATTVTESWTQQGVRPNIIIVDPPRKGCDPSLIQLILSLQPDILIYISCDPATLVRDLQLLDALFQVTCIQPVDMFSHTTHIETMVMATRRLP